MKDRTTEDMLEQIPSISDEEFMVLWKKLIDELERPIASPEPKRDQP